MLQRLQKWLTAGGTVRLVPVAAFLGPLLLGALPMYMEFGSFPSWAPEKPWRGRLLVVWFFLFLASELARRFLARRAVQEWRRTWEENDVQRADNLAGTIDQLCAPLLAAALGMPVDRQLAPDRIQAALLQGIVDIARVLTGCGEQTSIQAALLAHERRAEGPAGKPVDFLRVANYSRLAGRRDWSRFRVRTPGPAQDAFQKRRPEWVPDTEQGRNDAIKRKPYRSVVALPVSLSCGGGQPLAVVTLDASAPNVFAEAVRNRGFEEAVSPYLKLIALSRIVEQLGGRHGAGEQDQPPLASG